MTKTLTVEGLINNIDGIAFHRAPCSDHVEAVFYAPFTMELWDSIESSGIDPLKPIRAVLTIEQDE